MNLANGSIRKSSDGGATWTTVFPTTAAIFTIIIDPGNPDVLYVPTVGHGAFKSIDGGQHWSAMTALTSEAIWTMALDPANSQVLYAGTNQDGVWKSTDAGNTWRQAGSVGPFPVYSLAVDALTHMVYAGTNGGGVWTSGDGGVSWKATTIADGMVLALAVDSAGAVYAGTSSAGAKVSHDGGTTWTALNTGADRENKFGYGIWIDPKNNQKMFLGNEAQWGLVGTQDGGASWSTAGQGFTGRGTRGLAFDPTDSRRVYAGTMIGDGFFKSTDGGQTWSVRRFGSPAVYDIAVAVDPFNPNIVYVGTQNEGLFKSTDYGETWKSVGTGLSGAITFLTLDPNKSGRLFASTGSAFYLSEDGGQTWTIVLNMPAWTATIDPSSPLTVYATARTQGVFRSSDGGHTWQGISNGITNLSMGRSAPVIIDPTNRKTLYVGSEGGGVFKSLDGGDHWFAVNSGLSDLTVLGIAMDPANPAVLYACGPSGVFRTVTGAEVPITPTISAVLNGASYLPGPVAPSEIVIITGTGLGPGQLIVSTPGKDGINSTQLSGTSVQFNGIAAPVIYASESLVAVQVPLHSVGPAEVTVTYEGRASASLPLQITQNSPGLFTLDFSGKGQAVALNRNGSINTSTNPAAAAEVISIYATGIPFGQGGLYVSIGAQSAELVNAINLGGVTQFDVRIPSDMLSNPSVPVLVQIAGTSSQTGVTIALRGAGQIATDTARIWND
jgi:uncharacterized protein (TIGR03437 family)